MRVILRLTLPRDARYVPVLRAAASSVLLELGAPREDVEDVALVVSEACGNVVRHASGSQVYSVAVSVDAAGCAVEVVDVGPGFDVETPCPDSDSEAGRGLYLMRTLMDTLEFLADDDGTRIVLQKRWASSLHMVAPEGAQYADTDDRAPIAGAGLATFEATESEETCANGGVEVGERTER